MTPDPSGAAPERRDPDHLVVGHVTKPHGTKGEVFVWPLTDRPERVFAEGEELLLGTPEGELGDDPVRLEVQSAREFKRGRLLRFVGHEDRSAVEPLTQRYLLLPLERLEPLEEGELFYHQLLGLEVRTVEGERVGSVREVYETEPTHLLDVQGPEKRHLIPFTERVVRRIDLESGMMEIDPPRGLLDIA